MNLKNLLYLTLLTFVVSSCKNLGQKAGKTPGGFEYTKTEAGSGKAAADLDYVFFTLKVQGDDGVVLTEMEEGPNMPYLQINDQPIPTPDVKAVFDLLNGSKVGDSFKLLVPVDSLPQKSPEIAQLNMIEYYFTIKNIRNQDEFDAFSEELQKEMNAKMELGKLRVTEIEALVSTTLNDYKAGKLELKSMDSGLKYFVLEPGEGDNAKVGDQVKVNYYGALENGTRFDDSFSRGQSFPFKLGQGQVIKGWDESITYFNKGTKAFIFIPSDLAYGEMGSPPVIPPNTDLVFYVEVDEIKGN